MTRAHLGGIIFVVGLASSGCGESGSSTGGGTGGATEQGSRADAQAPNEAPEAAGLVSPISASVAHTCVVTPGGDMYCWGRNTNSELGDGTAQSRYTPVPVKGLKNVAQAATGHFHTCAATKGGEVYCWGRNEKGQVGDGTTTVRPAPVKVHGISDASGISAGENFSCAMHRSGKVSCWGAGDSGRLGRGNSEDSTTPVEVAGLTDAVQIVSGEDHSCAATKGGEVYCWGQNNYGQSALPGDLRESPRPNKVPGLSGVKQVAAGHYNTCAINAQGQLHCWGYNYHGQLGNGLTGSENNAKAPVHISKLQNVAHVAIGENHACAVTKEGAGYCWGDDGYGNLGGAERGDQTEPASVVNMNDGSFLALGESYTCAVRQSGAVACWGGGPVYVLGRTDISDQDHPTDIIPSLASLSAPAPRVHTFPADPSVEVTPTPMLSVYEGTGCAIREGNGHPICWGSNHRGGLGDGTTIRRVGEVVEVAGLTDAEEIRVGQHSTCARRANGEVACWGYLGRYNGSKNRVFTSRPIPLEGVSNAAGITVGSSMRCIRHDDGTVSCDRGSGNLEPIAGLEKAVQLGAGYTYGCARTENGEVSCWGTGRSGRLGNGANDRSEAAVQVSNIRDAEQLSVGHTHACALRRGGRVSCWGDNEDGQLGDGQSGDDVYSNTPVDVRGLRGAVAVAAGMNHTCALQRDNKTVCWGGNTFHQTGIAVDEGEENPEVVARPTEVQPGTAPQLAEMGTPTDVEAGWHLSCRIYDSGGVACWGASSVLGGGVLGGLISERSPMPIPLANVRLRSPAPAASESSADLRPTGSHL